MIGAAVVSLIIVSSLTDSQEKSAKNEAREKLWATPGELKGVSLHSCAVQRFGNAWSYTLWLQGKILTLSSFDGKITLGKHKLRMEALVGGRWNKFFFFLEGPSGSTRVYNRTTDDRTIEAVRFCGIWEKSKSYDIKITWDTAESIGKEKREKRTAQIVQKAREIRIAKEFWIDNYGRPYRMIVPACKDGWTLDIPVSKWNLEWKFSPRVQYKIKKDDRWAEAPEGAFDSNWVRFCMKDPKEGGKWYSVSWSDKK